ncbi:MAG: carboxypeptidase regulatory-like domain-containing protein [Candidatus Aminicenantes bacterium]|nr:carboxypeptidase regulatory-like domain-containing protein [Candidatus Aminicenantes bacterium]
MKIRKLVFLVLLVFFVSRLQGQELTGSLRGTITDPEGHPLPGVSVTISSPVLMGTRSFVTTETGTFRFPSLPPGAYKVVAELKGFKTVERTDVIVRVGMTVTIDIKMEPAPVAEEIVVVAPTPVVDIQSSKLSITVDSSMIQNLPIRRDLYDIMTAAPGVVSEYATYRRTFSAHGSTVRGNTTAFDGVNMNDPVVSYTMTNINFDVMEEVEIITAGHPASVGYTDGAYVNVVTKSGGNRFSGGAIIYHTQEGFNQHLWTDEQIRSLNVSKPEVDKSWWDGSFTLGGPIMIDKLWFFTNGRYIRLERKTNFVGPWTDFFGRTHNPYNWTHEETMGFFKLTSQLSQKMKLMGMFNLVDIYRPMYEEPGPRQPFISTRIWDHEKGYTGNGIVNYVLSQNTFLDIRIGYIHRWFPIPMQKEAQDLPWIDDAGDLYGGLTTARFNETYLRKRLQLGGYFTHFIDNWLGGNHEIKGGIEYENTYGDWDWWRKDNMIWYIDSRNANPYYYFGDSGYVLFYICGAEKGSSKIIDRGGRIGAYLQNSATIADRLTINLGIRFDRSWGWKPEVKKSASGNPLSVYLGETIVKPYIASRYPDRFPAGINPWGELVAKKWDDIINWNAFSPRFGLTYDLFGNGRTAFKFSFNRYTEYLMLQYFSTLHPFYPKSYGFYWWDENRNNKPDIGDRFSIYGTPDFREMDLEFAKLKLNPDTNSAYSDEIMTGIWHELFKNFSVGLNFIYKERKNTLEDVRYAPDTKEYWYHLDQPAAKKYWIPFTTTVPGTDAYPDRTVTFYVLSNDAPPTLYHLTNVPELVRKYWAFELIFNKRMSEGWQLSGSVVYSKAYGNIGGWFGESWGWSGAGDSPNWFVNRWGRQSVDRPLQIKLMGTVQLPYRIYLSGYYQYFSGSPWERSASIRPPTAWCTANRAQRLWYSVLIEQAGSRRGRAWNTMDARVEKEFSLGKAGRIGLYADITNLFGWSDVSVGLSDVWRWEPVAEGANQPGTKTLYTSYKVVSSVSGVRTLKLSIRYSF